MSTPERVDPHDTSSFDSWYDVFSVAVDDGRQYPVGFAREEMRAALTRENPYKLKELWALREAGEIVGGLELEAPLLDNTSLISGIVAVRADARRRGHGRALGRLLDERAAEHGRSVLISQVEVPSGATESTPGQRFATALGFSAANFEVHRVLELPLAPELLDELSAKAAERHQGYALRSWRDRCPDDLVDAFAALQTTFVLEAPTGDLEVEAEHWDAARIRLNEEQNVAQGRNSWTTVAVAPDGTLAGHTELVKGEHDPGKVFQWGTLVAPAHRGHWLGLGLKAHNHRELQKTHTEPLVVHTWNGEENTAMNAVNAQLGFQPVERHEEWQKILRAETLAGN
ncbi:GNAT family N-acetyltransferase [Kribbella sp. DT2]|uniref:GNAT family N-acetyltransferase n=1 Tax=Kribbella sp. DT2 TaxID=3393427 RepID=UPI003CF318F0